MHKLIKIALICIHFRFILLTYLKVFIDGILDFSFYHLVNACMCKDLIFYLFCSPVGFELLVYASLICIPLSSCVFNRLQLSGGHCCESRPHITTPIIFHFLFHCSPKTTRRQTPARAISVWTPDDCCDRQKSAGSDHKNRSETHSTGQIQFIILHLSLTQDLFLCAKGNFNSIISFVSVHGNAPEYMHLYTSTTNQMHTFMHLIMSQRYAFHNIAIILISCVLVSHAFTCLFL